ncbi:uncharacterized protein LOC113311265 [Papaver somniferum]|uniref:uncharacterized protein LOC113311265 n=1 Tax=Papaver somniferum TaxID=3469 RepID=UPI000E6FFD40|nr:uncharacterized protein LOC113311265 [Papaver somniferum]
MWEKNHKRYHLQDFCGEGRHPETANELFNLRHASLRNIVERIFGIFKSHFTIFESAPPFPYETQAHIVLACVGLHNFLRKECRFDEFPPEENDDSSSSELSSDDEEEGLDPTIQSQQCQGADANKWRSTIAAKMWKDKTGEGNNNQS